MHVSVVLPVFNEEGWMQIPLESLKNQTVPFELIVVDSESTDRSAEIAREYTSLVFTSPRGKLNAKNRGVLEATGDVVVMVDGDCYYPPNFLETITKHFDCSDVVMVAGLFYNVDGNVQKRISKIIVALRFFLFKYSPGSATAYRRDAFLQVGGYDIGVNQQDFLSTAFEEQVRFNWRIMHLGKMVYDPSAEALHLRPRELCEMFDGVCPTDYPAVWQYCQEVAEGERF